jgi:hypothetical protein
MHKVSTRRAKFKATDVFAGTFRGEEFLHQELDDLREKHGLDSANTTPVSVKQNDFPLADQIQIKKFDESNPQIQIRKDYSALKNPPKRQLEVHGNNAKAKDAFSVENISGSDFSRGRRNDSFRVSDTNFNPLKDQSNRFINTSQDIKPSHLKAQTQSKIDAKIDQVTT